MERIAYAFTTRLGYPGASSNRSGRMNCCFSAVCSCGLQDSNNPCV